MLPAACAIPIDWGAARPRARPCGWCVCGVVAFLLGLMQLSSHISKQHFYSAGYVTLTSDVGSPPGGVSARALSACCSHSGALLNAASLLSSCWCSSPSSAIIAALPSAAAIAAESSESKELVGVSRFVCVHGLCPPRVVLDFPPCAAADAPSTTPAETGNALLLLSTNRP